MMCSETLLSNSSSGLSSKMKTKSNRERRAALIFKFSFTVFARLQFGDPTLLITTYIKITSIMNGAIMFFFF